MSFNADEWGGFSSGDEQLSGRLVSVWSILSLFKKCTFLFFI